MGHDISGWMMMPLALVLVGSSCGPVLAGPRLTEAEDEAPDPLIAAESEQAQHPSSAGPPRPPS